MAEPEDRRADVKAASERKACTICGKPRDPHYDPFCSKRCADVDLHRWLNGAYVVPGGAANEPQGDEDE
jgi:uncharacterized protein